MSVPLSTSWNGTIDVKHQLCSGCRLCEIACSIAKEGKVYPAAARVRVAQVFPGPVDVPVLCHRCSDHPCLEACPKKVRAISWDEEHQVLRIDQEKCWGNRCNKRCVRACPQGGAIFIHPDTGKAMACDVCDGDPACVKACPLKTLWYLPGSTFDGKHYAARSPQKVSEAVRQRFYPGELR